MMNKYLKISLIFAVVAISIVLRIFTANTLPINTDESVYVNAGFEYAYNFRESKWNWLAWSSTNFEHPALNKIVYGIAMLTQKPIDYLFDKDVGTMIHTQ